MSSTYWIADVEGQHLLRRDNVWVPVADLEEHRDQLLTLAHHGLACDVARGLMLAGHFVRVIGPYNPLPVLPPSDTPVLKGGA